MKTKLLSLTAIVCAIAFIINDGYSHKSGQAGNAGGPSEATCLTSGCHTGNALNVAPGSVVISSPNLTNFVYTPGVTYTINVTVSKTGVGLFGFSMESLRSNGANAGTFVHTSPTVTQSLNATIAGNSRTYATHKLNAGLSANSKTFTFNWVAPSTNLGTITFYATGNAANNNNSTQGDFIYSTSHVVHDSATAAGISEPAGLLEGVNVFPNPVASLLGLSLNIKEQSDLKIELYNIEGKFQQLLLLKSEIPGQHNYSFDINGLYARGLYLIKVESGNKIAVKKIFIQ